MARSAAYAIPHRHEWEGGYCKECGRKQTAATIPGHLAAHIERWLVSNQKEPDEVRWGQFPLGMVQRWVERAEEAEAKLATLAEAKRVMEGLSFGYEPTEADHEEAAFPWA